MKKLLFEQSSSWAITVAYMTSSPSFCTLCVNPQYFQVTVCMRIFQGMHITCIVVLLKLPGRGLMRATWGCVPSNPWKDHHGMFVKGGRDFKGRIREPQTLLLLLKLIKNRSIRWQLGNLLEIMGFNTGSYFFSFFDHDEMHITIKTLQGISSLEFEHTFVSTAYDVFLENEVCECRVPDYERKFMLYVELQPEQFMSITFMLKNKHLTPTLMSPNVRRLGRFKIFLTSNPHFF